MSTTEKLLPAWAAKILSVRKANKKNRPLDKDGKYYGSPVPVEPPLGYKRQPSIAENIRAMIRSEALAEAARKSGYETLEEGDDFDVQDDYDPTSPWEYNFDPIVDPQSLEALSKKLTDGDHAVDPPLETAGKLDPKLKPADPGKLDNPPTAAKTE